MVDKLQRSQSLWADFNIHIHKIMAMGYERSLVEQALQASITPICCGILPQWNPVRFLQSQPQLEQMQQLVGANPHLLNALLQQTQTNPALLQVISENQVMLLNAV